MSTAEKTYSWSDENGEQITGDLETFTAYLQSILDTFPAAELRSLQETISKKQESAPDIQDQILLDLIPSTLKQTLLRDERIDREEEGYLYIV